MRGNQTVNRENKHQPTVSGKTGLLNSNNKGGCDAQQGGFKEGLRFVIEIEVNDIGRFKAEVSRCVEISKTEPGTLVYNWYLDEGTGRARLYEGYESVEALLAHMTGPVFTDVGPQLMRCCKFIHVDALGDLANQPSFWPTTFWGPSFAKVST
jgi:quinol monooxygenase YgiN